MDVIDIPELQKTYRVVPISQKGLALHPIEGEEKEFKLCKVTNKTTVKEGHIQLHLNDGRNKLIKVTDPINPVEDEYKTIDLLKISIPEGEVMGHVQFKEGIVAIVTEGKNRGRWGKLTRVERIGSLHRPIVTIDDNGKQFKTSLNNVFVIGDKEPWISLPEV
jgi:small subunit ribosomal protein S4e